jgi:hypothetical protein
MSGGRPEVNRVDGRQGAAVTSPSTVVRPEGVSTVNVVAMWVLPIPVTVGRLR